MKLCVNDEKLQLHLTDTAKFHIKELEKYTYQINLKPNKMKKYEITEEQIKENKHLTLEQYFKEVFETKLEVGKWYKVIDKNNQFKESECAIVYFDNKKGHYGLGFGKEYTTGFKNLHEVIKKNTDKVILATDSEVLEALTNEAKKRGFGKKGTHFKSVEGLNEISNLDGFDFWNLDSGECDTEHKFNISVSNQQGIIFKCGKWATLIKTYTKEEAEKMLNAKIV